MPTLPPGVQNAPPSASKRKAAGGKGKNNVALTEGSSARSARIEAADTIIPARMGGPSMNSPFTTMPFQPASANGMKGKQSTHHQQVHPQHQHQHPHPHPQPHSQSPGDVFVVQTPQALQGRTLQPTSAGLMPGYGHGHVPQLYHIQGHQQQPQHSGVNMQSPMGLYTHQSEYPQFPQQQQHPGMMVAPQTTQQQNGQAMSLKRPFPDERGFHPDQLAGMARGSIDLKNGAPVYVDQFGRPFRYEGTTGSVSSADLANFSMENTHMDGPPAKRIKLTGSHAHDMLAAMAEETAPMTLAEVQALLTHADGPMESLAEIADADVENGDDFEIEDGEFAGELPPGTRLASKPQRPISSKDASFATSTKDKNQSQQRARTKLLAIFEASSYDANAEVDLDSVLASSPRSSPALGNGDTSIESITAHTGIDVDQVIDERGHTALHWAAALARGKLVGQLIARGADINRGNFAGETPLIRAVLAVNNAESTASFHLILAKHLGASLRTIDNNHRTVLHHISAVAGIKGRSASANTYMSTLLAWMATVETPDQIRECVNIQDVNGDTALNVAARVGNRNLVKLLLDAGADKSKANKLGLRPGDFGVQVEVCRKASACVFYWLISLSLWKGLGWLSPVDTFGEVCSQRKSATRESSGSDFP
jgi:ankyrin repeat protein